MKPIVGVDLLIREVGDRVEPSRLVASLSGRVGYQNLTAWSRVGTWKGKIRGLDADRRSWMDATPLRA